jgi:hypothetical protein
MRLGCGLFPEHDPFLALRRQSWAGHHKKSGFLCQPTGFGLVAQEQFMLDEKLGIPLPCSRPGAVFVVCLYGEHLH